MYVYRSMYVSMYTVFVCCCWESTVLVDVTTVETKLATYSHMLMIISLL